MSLNLFDINFYRTANPDLNAAGLTTDTQLTVHFQNYGLNEGRLFSPFVNLSLYSSLNPDLAAVALTSNQQLLEHLQNYGVAEGRSFSSLLSINFYLANNSDVFAAFNGDREKAFTHLITYGLQEGRRFSQFCDINFYLTANADVNKFYQGNRQEALQHLVIYGFNEKRIFSQFFDINFYQANNLDLVIAGFSGKQLLEHFENYGLGEGRNFSVGLNLSDYLNNNPDLIAAKLSNQQLYEHFQTNGLKEGRNGSRFLSVSYYLNNNSDLKAAGFNNYQAYDHFIFYGHQQEGRNGNTGNPENPEEWRRQLGTYTFEISRTVAVDKVGNSYITGGTYGALGRRNNEGTSDVYIAKYDRYGNVVWIRQFGTGRDESSFGVIVDNSNNIYITGKVNRSVAPADGPDDNDAFVVKYNWRGSLLWYKELGTNPKNDEAFSVSVDKTGNVYIVGQTNSNLDGSVRPAIENFDAWVAKYDSNGNQVWIRQFGGIDYDIATAVTVDGVGNIYIAGETYSRLTDSYGGEGDGWLAKFDSQGNQAWVRTIGTTARDTASSIAVDKDNYIYITGNTYGFLGGDNAGSSDIWFAKYDDTGNPLFLKQLGTDKDDMAKAIALNSQGNIYIAGNTNGKLGDIYAGGFNDVWFGKFDNQGNRQIIKQQGTTTDDVAFGIALFNEYAFITGYSNGAFAGNAQGDYDTWIVRLMANG